MSDKQDAQFNSDNIHPMARILFGWTTFPKIKSILLIVLTVLSILLIAVDFSGQRHPHNEAEALVGFYGIYGFISFAFAVLMGWPLGRLLRRDENYYEDDEAHSTGAQDLYERED